ncbi:hypothetical protein VARIO8X_130157 [Burkholderiales bacterium 8X]|nr:hypothetical protein VARIO8X_130157 [Burkholderiales bacterium 8X]
MNAHHHIRHARASMGLSDREVARRAELAVEKVTDIEDRAEAFIDAISIRAAFRLCTVLGVSIYQVLDVNTVPHPPRIPVARYVGMIRRTAGLSQADLEEKIGCEKGFVQKVEEGGVDLLSFPTSLALGISDSTQSSQFQMLNMLEQASETPKAKTP